MSAGSEGFIHPEFLIESEGLAAQLGDPELRVFDCTIHLIPNPDIGYRVLPGREDFEKGHIPGAQFIDLQADLSAPHPKLRFMLPGAADFAAAMGRFGVGDKSRVILYSTTTPQWATRVWWMLRNYGFDNAAVLNGGFQKWVREGRAVETGPARPRPPATFTVRENRGLMVGKEAVKGAIGDPTTCTLNALSAAQHTGTGGTVYGRVGRIAKSVNVPAAALIDPATGAFLPAAALRAKFAAVGAFDKKRVITYCGGGIAASADALALVMLGHPDVRLYDASMSEWSNDESLPMETGD
jgi:thiosulfate/3-mercaptopyruvate sulfurtransferase